jgi:hypothetical protein
MLLFVPAAIISWLHLFDAHLLLAALLSITM